VRADKQREANAGHDGTWVAHPALVSLARAEFDARLGGKPNQQDVLRADVGARSEAELTAALLKPALGTITRAGFENNVEVCVRYLAAWLDGNGCVPIHWLMEDAATAEIARTQLWQWLHAPTLPGSDGQPLHLDDGSPIDEVLLERALIGLPNRLADRMRLPGAERLAEAIDLLEQLTHAGTLADFLTVPAYDRID
jgi:malate synthase